jgi:hypothetical protein
MSERRILVVTLYLGSHLIFKSLAFSILKTVPVTSFKVVSKIYINKN